MEQSRPFSLNRADLMRIGGNAFTFLGPVLIIYIGSVTNGLKLEPEITFDQLLQVFKPSPMVVGAMVLYVLNTVTDAVRKFIDG